MSLGVGVALILLIAVGAVIFMIITSVESSASAGGQSLVDRLLAAIFNLAG